MRNFRVALLALLLVAAASASASDVALTFGPSVIALNGPWKFHTGDNLRWARPDFDDAQWEPVDLTPAPGSHDDDVGLKNYVPGWAARGHPNYIGFAWYRLSVSTPADGPQPLWLVGPADVDNAYQVYFNGHLVGGIGDFSRDPPSIVAIQPRLFALPRQWWITDGALLRGVVAFRVVLLKGTGLARDGGGIHIAPLLGTAKGAADHYQLEWLQTVEGYAVDAVEPVVFCALALMALCLLPFEPRARFYSRLAAALVLLALARFNQPLFFLAQFETFRDFLIWRLVIVDSLTLGAWTMAWLIAFRGTSPRWATGACAVLTVLYGVSRFCGSALLMPASSAATLHVLAQLRQGVRWGFLALLIYAAWGAVVRRSAADWVGLLALILGCVGVFASELSLVGIPGIWFPYGVGVSRTEYAYAAFFVVMFVYLLMRLWRHAAAVRQVPQAG